MQDMTMNEMMATNGGDLEDLAWGLGAALGAAGAVVATASIPFTGPAGVAAAASSAGLASYSWGCLTD